ncbi:glycoside hydrolase family 16 protein [Aurantiacibacter aquimixticola]|uniref:Glycoside hydrolase family 16 protein n=1 Tax=Aurantiacibacter aquimixticola TaxID=1958945 RepID=A0A419RW50_9SPHN|nr:glycoside hydrolase family 16 protein [Aurantiacibacter aquimixticola]RJY09994.1 glycoside hydrolase family 16 protein [Aurantiacibacter aquimixticola]
MGTFTKPLALCLPLLLASCQSASASADTASQDLRADRTLIFADEFDSGALDRDSWNVIGMDFWVNREEQAYLDDPRTIRFADEVDGADGGVLILQPVYAPGVDANAEREADFISGRIESQGKVEFTYGRAEARIRMPDAPGVWPAFWLLGNGRWPDTGEIDIMEYVGEPDWYGVAVHGPGYSGDAGLDNRYFFDAGTDATDWHVYAVEWTRDAMIFEIDDRPMFRVTRPMTEYFGTWEFDNPKYLILNFAMGGAYPAKTNGVEEPYYGLPADTAQRAQAGELYMEVDWVRVYSAGE